MPQFTIGTGTPTKVVSRVDGDRIHKYKIGGASDVHIGDSNTITTTLNDGTLNSNDRGELDPEGGAIWMIADSATVTVDVWKTDRRSGDELRGQ